jgi:hypothetical protein
MKHSKEDLLKVCAFIGLPNYVDKVDPEINEIKNYLITKHARATIQDALLNDPDIIDLKFCMTCGLIPMEDRYDIEIDYVVQDERKDTDAFRHDAIELYNSCHNMLWLDVAVWWVNEKT